MIGKDGDREDVIIKYEQWVSLVILLSPFCSLVLLVTKIFDISNLLSQPDLVKTVKTELKGKILACWCAPQPCHGRITIFFFSSFTPSIYLHTSLLLIFYIIFII